MRRVLVALTLALLLSACSDEEAPPTTPGNGTNDGSENVADVPTDPEGIVTVIVRDDKNAAAESTDVDCETDPDFCEAVLSNEAIQPTGPGVACTQQYGGPQEAFVAGEVAKEPVELYFTRTNGCEIARWDALQELLKDLSTPIELGVSGGV